MKTPALPLKDRRLHEDDERMPRNVVLLGDAATRLARLPAESVDCVITSPPYVGLRRYEAGAAEIGSETSVGTYVTRLLSVTEELAPYSALLG